MGLFLSILSIPVKGQEMTWYDDFSDINYLEYFIDFYPDRKGYFTTKYAMELNKITEGDNTNLIVDIHYDDLDLTSTNGDFFYVISLKTREILDTSDKFYDIYLNGTYTELFLNLSNIGNPQLFRIDENVIFNDYLTRGFSVGLTKITTEFNYIGEVIYNKNLLHNFTTYHYSAVYSWSGPGIAWDNYASWTLEADYFFDKITGFLIAETLLVHRWDYKDNKPNYVQYDSHYFDRKLAMVNSQIILKDYQKIIKANAAENIYWFIFLGIIVIFAALIKKRRYYNESTLLNSR